MRYNIRKWIVVYYNSDTKSFTVGGFYQRKPDPGALVLGRGQSIVEIRPVDFKGVLPFVKKGGRRVEMPRERRPARSSANAEPEPLISYPYYANAVPEAHTQPQMQSASFQNMLADMPVPSTTAPAPPPRPAVRRVIRRQR